MIGTIRRECLDYVIPLSESHLKRTLREWVNHYNIGRPHSPWDPAFPIRLSPPRRQCRIPNASLRTDG
ncbi:MAG: integrase core domain-containing protein [Bryobacteraceae bacterium]